MIKLRVTPLIRITVTLSWDFVCSIFVVVQRMVGPQLNTDEWILIAKVVQTHNTKQPRQPGNEMKSAQLSCHYRCQCHCYHGHHQHHSASWYTLVPLSYLHLSATGYEIRTFHFNGWWQPRYRRRQIHRVGDCWWLLNRVLVSKWKIYAVRMVKLAHHSFYRT